MSCIHEERLGAWLDGELDAAQEETLRTHLRECQDCCRELASLQRLLAAARNLPSAVDPPRDLWPEVEASLPLGPSAAQRGRLPWLAAAAALVILLGAGVYLAWNGRGGPPQVADGGPVPAAANKSLPASAEEHQESLGALEAAFATTRQQLLADLEETARNQGPDSEPSEAELVVRRNLETIEQAIAEIRAALEKEPGNRQLQRRLLASYQQEMELLTLATRLSRS